MILLAGTVKKIHEEGGFEMRRWTSTQESQNTRMHPKGKAAAYNVSYTPSISISIEEIFGQFQETFCVKYDLMRASSTNSWHYELGKYWKF